VKVTTTIRTMNTATRSWETIELINEDVASPYDEPLAVEGITTYLREQNCPEGRYGIRITDEDGNEHDGCDGEWDGKQFVTDDERTDMWTTTQAAEYCGVTAKTYRGYVSNFGAPGAVAREPGRGGENLHFAFDVREWHAKRAGQGKRNDLVARWLVDAFDARRDQIKVDESIPASAKPTLLAAVTADERQLELMDMTPPVNPQTTHDLRGLASKYADIDPRLTDLRKTDTEEQS
jgi:hypothetical protein